MPPRLPQKAIALTRTSSKFTRAAPPSLCLFCTYSQNAQSKKSSRRSRNLTSPNRASFVSPSTRYQSTIPSTTSPDPRTELQNILKDLQKHASRFVNLSRLQLALNGLQHKPGDEPIRIAVLGLQDGGSSYNTAKEILRLLIADPLKAEEEWETILMESKQTGKPILLRVGQHETEGGSSGNWLIHELKVASPSWNGHKVEFLILGLDPIVGATEEQLTESLLVPAMEIPTSNTGRYTPVTTPVHKSIIVGEGLGGIMSTAGFPIMDADLVQRVINIQSNETETALPFQVVDASKGQDALQLFRQSIENAIEYEHKWFASGLPELVEWIKLDTAETPGMLKTPVRKLITTLLSSTSNAIEAEAAIKLASVLSQRVSHDDLSSLRKELRTWAEQAHTELRDQLDVAFDGRRWRKLSWWKLFWRVDDVSMISSDILNRSFLTVADKNIIYLAGQIAQAKDAEQSSYTDPNWAYKPVVTSENVPRLGNEPLPPNLETLPEPRHRVIASQIPQWPIHIPLARDHLTLKTVPALQALAQKLVLQTLSTSSFASIAAGLMYVSTISTSLYEAGAVAALGIVWSMRRMQGKWESARKFWEGEVREEGRKAVRGVEGVVAVVLTPENQPVEVDEELQRAKELVLKAQDALDRCK